MNGLRSRRIFLLAITGLLLSACAGGASPAMTTVAESRAVSSLEDVRKAVVRIEVEGTFEYPSGTSYNEAGSGSGFFISDDGLIVTNNHVVAGAGRIKVYVDQMPSPLNGRVVGTSECADLAVVDVDVTNQGFLAWENRSITAGSEVFVAGFPLGDPEYTLVDGIISKERANGDSDWASVDAVIEHTADTLPGSSGGPIVGLDGTVLGVNYAGDDFGQAFGISAELASGIVDKILTGNPTLSIGINGWAHDDGDETGVWVASVVPNSPADRVGIASGDLITRLAGLTIAGDGSLAKYCDILDTHSPDRPFEVEVWRTSTGSYMEGVINSDQTLEITRAAIAQDELGDLGDSAWGDLNAGTPYQDHELVWDDQGAVSLELPVEWSDRLSGPWEEYDEVVGVLLMASPDLDQWAAGWDTPGVLVGVSSSLAADGVDPQQFLGDLEVDDCLFAEQIPYDDGFYVGAINLWVDCGGSRSMFVDWAALDSTGETLINAQFIVVSEADVDAAINALSTLFLTSDLDY